MAKPEQSKNQEIKELYQAYCKKHLDKDYLKLCDKVYKELLFDEDVFKRGKPNIWAAAIVWAVGSVNFLGDKASEPYSSLKDVCDHFDTNTSTVGQKAGLIREWFDIDNFNDEYLHEDSPVKNILNNLVMTENGIIIPRSMLENGEDEFIDDDEEITDEDELPDKYIIILSAHRNMNQANLYELEYLFKSVLSEDEHLSQIRFADKRIIHIHFYGRPYKAGLLDDKLQRGHFEVIDLVDDNSE